MDSYEFLLLALLVLVCPLAMWMMMRGHRGGHGSTHGRSGPDGPHHERRHT